MVNKNNLASSTSLVTICDVTATREIVIQNMGNVCIFIKKLNDEISGSYGGEYEDDSRLGCCAV
jgi:hypothetical protein